MVAGRGGENRTPGLLLPKQNGLSGVACIPRPRANPEQLWRRKFPSGFFGFNLQHLRSSIYRFDYNLQKSDPRLHLGADLDLPIILNVDRGRWRAAPQTVENLPSPDLVRSYGTEKAPVRLHAAPRVRHVLLDTDYLIMVRRYQVTARR